MAIGVAGLELETSRRTVLQREHEAVVVGVADVLRLGDDAETRIGDVYRQVRKRRASRAECVERGIGHLLIRAMVAHVLCAETRVPAERLLEFEVPLIVPRYTHRSTVEEVERGDDSAACVVRLETRVRGSQRSERAVGPHRGDTTAGCELRIAGC